MIGADVSAFDLGPQPWRALAACRDYPPTLFFPVGRDDEEDDGLNVAAKAVCARCPVEADCLEYALAAGEKHGVWGRHTALERQRVLRQRRVASRAG